MPGWRARRGQTRLSDLGESGLLAQLRAALRARAPQTARPPRGIGDDAALLPMAAATVAGTDMLVEDVDFRARWATPVDVGHKAAEANLSDLAAMGARPAALLAAVALPGHMAASAALALLLAIDERARLSGASLVGGDLSATHGPVVVAVTALGVRSAHVLTRHTAKIGDLVCVSGKVGAAAAGLALLEANRSRAALACPSYRALTRAQLRPVAPVALGQALGAAGVVTACADVSDGLVADVLHLVAPGAGVALDTTRLPAAAGLAQAASALCGGRQATTAGSPACGRLVQQWGLCGGEDYGLVMSVPREGWPLLQRVARDMGSPITPIGRVVAQAGVRLWPPGMKGAAGAYQHFSSPTKRR